MLTRKDLEDIAKKGPYKDWGIDPECMELCVSLNKIDGIETYSSCCGHNKRPFQIWFRVKTLDGLRVLTDVLLHTAPPYYPESFWKLYCDINYLNHGHSDDNSVIFTLEGPRGCYNSVNALAKLIDKFLMDNDL